MPVRLQSVYDRHGAHIGKFLAGQTNSTFMDGDVFPNSLEYWGPTGMVFYRNIQLRYSPLMTKQDNLAFALEQPGASGDGGVVNDFESNRTW